MFAILTFIIFITKCAISDRIHELHLKSQYRNIVLFGDDDVDLGRGYLVTGGYPKSPYYFGRYTNGLTWGEYLAELLDADVISFGYGNATISAKTKKIASLIKSDSERVETPIPDLSKQIEVYLEYLDGQESRTAKFDPEYTLYALNFGKSELFSIIKNISHLSIESAQDYVKESLIFVVNQLLQYMEPLLDSKKIQAQNILLVGVPGLGHLHGYSDNHHARVVSDMFNRILNEQVNTVLKNRVKNLYIPHLGKFDENIIKFTDNQVEAIEKRHKACINTTKIIHKICEDPDNHIWWDETHITTKVHSHLAQYIFQQMLINTKRKTKGTFSINTQIGSEPYDSRESKYLDYSLGAIIYNIKRLMMTSESYILIMYFYFGYFLYKQTRKLFFFCSKLHHVL